jgi:isopenicillin-N N-acyltransferase-like protein
LFFAAPPPPARAVTRNNLEGPSAQDPNNLGVRAHTSTLARRVRGDELVAALPAQVNVSVSDAVRCLRDHQGAGGRALALGDRDAINALIATHGVVMDTGRRVLWVSESPHLLGRFVAFELDTLLAADYRPGAPEGGAARPADDGEFVPPDPLLTSGEYQRYRLKK